MTKRRKNYNYEFDLEGIFIFFGICFAFSILIRFYKVIFIIACIILVYLVIRIIISTDIFGKFKGVILYYNGNNSEKKIEDLKQNDINNSNEYKINCIKKGIYGENKVLYVLKNSDIPMYILHDLNLCIDDRKSQIDFIIVTKKNLYVIEVKDLNGNLDIESDGTFTRRFGRYKKGIKNPLTQNNEHQMTLKKIAKKENLRIKFQSIIVLSNDSSYINYKKGSKDKYTNIIRNDQLYNYIKNIEKKTDMRYSEKKIKSICDSLLKYNVS